MDADHLPPPTLELAASRGDGVRIIAGGRRVAELRAASVVALGLRNGMPLTPETLAAIESRAAFERAYKIAVAAIARRPLSAQAVRDRLAKRGVERGAVDGVVDALRAEGLIDDAELARRLLHEENARGGAGAALLGAKLAARGIDPEAAAQVMEEEEDGPSPAARALAAAERRAESLPLSLSPEGKARRLYAFLARRGFEEQDAAEAVRRVLGISADEGG